MKRRDIWFVVGVLLVLLGILMFIGVVKAAPSYSDVSSNLTYVPMGDSVELRTKWTPGDAPYDVSTGVYNDYLSTDATYGNPMGIAFNDDGTKLYIATRDIAAERGYVMEYNLPTPYDVSTGSFNDVLEVTNQTYWPVGIAFNDDGTKLYVAGYVNARIFEYNLSTPYDVSTGVYNDYLNVSAQTSYPTGIAFNNDGTKLYVAGFDNAYIFEYNLSTPYDISTGVYVDYLNISAQSEYPMCIGFNNNGTKLFVVNRRDPPEVLEYILSAPYDVSTGVYNDYLNISSQVGYAEGIAFNNDGAKLYISEEDYKVHEYNLTGKLDTAILYVNVTGSYQAVDTIDLGDSLTPKWSNFSYTPTTCNKVVGWKITANDSSGASNTTTIGTFYVMPYLYSTSDSSIISSIASCSSKHNATITPTGSGDVNLTFYMPYFVRNATFKECNYEVTEDADRVKISPSTEYCAVYVTNLEAESGTTFYVKESTGIKAFPPSNLPAAVASAGLVIIVIYSIVTRKRS